MTDGYVDLEDVIGPDDAEQRLSSDSAGKLQFVSDGSFRMGPKGLFFDEGGDGGKAWICDPFEILAATRDDAGSSWGLMLRWRDPDHREHLWAMPRQLLYGDGATLCGELASRGLSIAPDSKRRNLLLGYLATVQPAGRVTCVNRTGWHGSDHQPVYVLPDRTIGDAGADKMVLQTKSAIRSPFEERGSLEEWKQQVAEPCEKNSRLAFAVSASLAGPLLWLTGTESGGFHLVGASSQGKTTALQVGASVWGRGEKAHFIKTWRGTSNGMEGVASTHSDAALVLDEIGQAPASAVAEAATCWRRVSVRFAPSETAMPGACTVACDTLVGRVTVSAKIAEDRGKRVAAGQMIRLIDLPSDAGQGLGAFDVIPSGFAGPKALSMGSRQP